MKPLTHIIKCGYAWRYSDGSWHSGEWGRVDSFDDYCMYDEPGHVMWHKDAAHDGKAVRVTVTMDIEDA